MAEKNKPNCIIWDMDGTLVNVDHIVHNVRDRPKNWPAFNAGLRTAPEYPEIVMLWKSLEISNPELIMLVVTARNEDCRETTTDWLKDRGLFPAKIYMREVKDHRKDYETKFDLLMNLRSDEYEPLMVFEDRDGPVKMWRDNGIRCLQVQNGDY